MDLLIPYPQSSNQIALIHLQLNQPNIIITLLQTKVNQVMDLTLQETRAIATFQKRGYRPQKHSSRI